MALGSVMCPLREGGGCMNGGHHALLKHDKVRKVPYVRYLAVGQGSLRSDDIYHRMIQYVIYTDLGISTLVELHDQIIDQGNGYWIKIEAWQVAATPDTPHGIRYSLTLHEPYGKRILGYDNAHAVKPPKKFKYAGTKLPYDHKHRHVSDKGVPYEFRDAHQLLADFFTEVDRVLKEIKRS